MTVNYQITVNEQDIARLQKRVQAVKGGANKVLSRTNNKMLDKAKTESGNYIKKISAFSITKIKRTMIKEKATQQKTRAVLYIPNQGLLIAFYTWKLLARGGISAKIFPAGTTKFPKAYVIPNLRYTQTPKGAPAQRKKNVTDARRPSDWLYGPSPSQMFQVAVQDDEFKEFLAVEQQKILQNQVEFLLRSI